MILSEEKAMSVLQHLVAVARCEPPLV
jgi:hypothetical protein